MATPEKAVPSAAARPKKKRKYGLLAVGGFDMPFLIVLLLILSIGLICMFSASFVYAYYNDGDSYFYIKKQMIFALIGVVAMLLCSCVDYHWWHKAALPLMGIAFALLIIVLLLPSASGIRRWIRIPGIGQFQPSEVAKFAMIVLFSHMIALNQKKMKTFTVGFLLFLGILLAICGLVMIEPHLSGTILLAGIGLVMMFVGGTRIRYLVGLILIGIVAVYLMVFVVGYERERVDVWLAPFESYAGPMRDQAWQTVQSLYAIGSGGLLGQGLGNSRQKHLFLPEPQNDFVFAVVCEELGFVGAVIIILLFAVLLWRGFAIAMKARDKFGFMLAIGLTAQIGLQVALNLAVVSNLFPNTGISLPFFSYGGTSLVMLLSQMGIILSVSRGQNRLHQDLIEE